MAGLSILQQGFASLIVLGGLLCGVFLSLIAPEELKDGKKYFWMLANLLVAFILGFYMYHMNINIYIVCVVAIMLFALLFRISLSLQVYFLFIVAVLVVLFLTMDPVVYSVEIVLLFILGFPLGSIYVANKTSLANVHHR